ncbi:Vam6/Vps39-like protein [Halotydeus destructor]|nr:Vam6/Vps39-like protein [Halotydeus destructor]
MDFLRNLLVDKGHEAKPDLHPEVLKLDIYKCIPVVANFSNQITCMAAYDDCLIIGTKDGHILKRTQESKRVLKPKFETLFKSAGAKKSIVQIEVFPDIGILISLSDKVISVHSLNATSSARLPFDVEGSQGATSFATNAHNSGTVVDHDSLKLCAVIEKKLMLFYWKDGHFIKLAEDLSLPEIPKTVAWFKDSIWVCVSDEYIRIDYKSGNKIELFSVGDQEPSIVPLEYRNEVALGFGTETYLFGTDYQPAVDRPLLWRNCPIAILDDMQCLVALFPDSIIEVQSVKPRLIIQRIADFPKQLGSLKLLVKCLNKKGKFFIATASDVYCLTSQYLNHHVQELLKLKQFELALCLNQESDETQATKNRRTKEIEDAHALDYLDKRDIAKSLTSFRKSNADPTRVLGLFSPLLSPIYPISRTASCPSTFELNEEELKVALDSLIDYLLYVRLQLRDVENSGAIWPDLEPEEAQSKKTESMEMVDTCLLECYLKTKSDERVERLIRSPDNHCHVERSEDALKRHRKYNELKIFYQRKGLHKKALGLAQGELGPENIDLIFHYATWVIKKQPEDGLRIFLDDERFEQLPRQPVIEFLERTSPGLVILYLESLVVTGSDSSRTFENALIHKYEEGMHALISDYMKSIREMRANATHVSESEELEVHGRFSLFRRAIGLKEQKMSKTSGLKDGTRAQM